VPGTKQESMAACSIETDGRKQRVLFAASSVQREKVTAILNSPK
jgi:hypothetical protein